MTYKADGTYTTVCPRDCFGVCSLNITLKDGHVTHMSGNKANENSEGFICIKGASYTKRLDHPNRLKYPMIRDRKTNELTRTTWENALNLIAEKLNNFKEQYGSESIMYLDGWGHAGLFNDYAQLFWSQFGSITSTYGSLCMAGGKLGITYTYGDVVKHNSNSDLQNAKLIIVWGANPANTNIHRMRNIKKAVTKGAKLIVIDPRVSETMIDGAMRVHPRGGTDGLLALGIAKLLVERNLCDEGFIEKYVLGFDAYKKHLDAYDLDEISAITEVGIEKLSEIVDEIEKSPIYALITGTGKSRYSNAGQTERCVCVLPALTGSVGVSGGGFYFTDSQTPTLKWPEPSTEGFEMVSKIHVGEIANALGLQTPKIKALWIEKTNPLTSAPNVNAMIKAFSEVDFIVSVEHFMTDTARVADLVLPAAMFTEKDDLISVYGDSYLHLLQKLVEPLGECKSEPEIYRLLGAKLGLDLNALPVIDPLFIDGFLKFNALNTTYQELTTKPYLFENYSPIAYGDKIFNTPSGKIEIYSEQMLNWNADPLPTYTPIQEHKITTPMLYSQYPIHFMSSHANERINSQFTEMEFPGKNKVPKVQMNTLDASKRSIVNGDLVRIYNDRGEIEIIAEVGDYLLEGTAHVYEGWGETYKASINKLTLGRKTDIGNGTAFHDCLVEITKL